MSENKVYGYARISRRSQRIDRQIRNIKELYPEAYIFQEAFTGTKIQGRKELDKLLKVVKKDDCIVFDSASRMSRNVEEAMILYEELFNKGVKLVFLKEPHINSDVYRKSLENQLNISLNTGDDATDRFISGIIEALNRYTIDLARQQVKLVFAQAEKEVNDNHQRVKEGIITARLNNKQIGQPKGAKLTTKKSIKAKELIAKFSKDFNGSLEDPEVIILSGISKNTYYKYKREMREEVL